MAQVTSISELREFFGLSQEFLAFYLGVSHSTVNMSQRRERSLPLPAMKKLVNLIHFANAQPAPAPPPKKKAAKEGTAKKSALQKLAAECRVTTYNLEKQLAETKAAYAQALHAQALADFLENTTVDEKEKEDVRVWVNLLRNVATRQEKRNGPEAQAVLQWKLDWYTYGEQRAKALEDELAG